MSPRSVRRKIAVATWRAPSEGRISARAEVDVSAVLDHVELLRSEHGVRVTLTHVVGAALGRAMREVPEALQPRKIEIAKAQPKAVEKLDA